MDRPPPLPPHTPLTQTHRPTHPPHTLCWLLCEDHRLSVTVGYTVHDAVISPGNRDRKESVFTVTERRRESVFTVTGKKVCLP